MKTLISIRIKLLTKQNLTVIIWLNLHIDAHQTNIHSLQKSRKNIARNIRTQKNVGEIGVTSRHNRWRLPGGNFFSLLFIALFQFLIFSGIYTLIIKYDSLVCTYVVLFSKCHRNLKFPMQMNSLPSFSYRSHLFEILF